MLFTPAVSANSTYIRIKWQYADDPYSFAAAPMCSAPRTIPIRVSTIIELDEGMLLFSANNGGSNDEIGIPLFNGTGNIANVMSVSKARFYLASKEGTPNSLVRFEYNAYQADNPFPAGSHCMVWVEEV